MTDYSLKPFYLINKETGEKVSRKDIQLLAKEKGFFEKEFSSFSLMLKDNGTPVVFGYNPMVSFALERDKYLLRWVY